MQKQYSYILKVNSFGYFEVLEITIKKTWMDHLCDCINSSTCALFFFFSLLKTYFLDDMMLLKFRERISSKN